MTVNRGRLTKISYECLLWGLKIRWAISLWNCISAVFINPSSNTSYNDGMSLSWLWPMVCPATRIRFHFDGHTNCALNRVDTKGTADVTGCYWCEGQGLIGCRSNALFCLRFRHIWSAKSNIFEQVTSKNCDNLATLSSRQALASFVTASSM